MSQYTTRYPHQIELSNGETVILTYQDNKNRILLLETTARESVLRDAFSQKGFKNTSVEVVKEHQNGDGMLKHLNKDWDMHVRFLHIHEGLIAVDAEVETSREYVEHITKDNWISVIYEVWEIVEQVTSKIFIFHKTSGQYVTNILKDASIGLTKFKNQIEWKPLVVGSILGVTLGLILKELLKK